MPIFTISNMKKYSYFLIIFFISLNLHSQVYKNHWVNDFKKFDSINAGSPAQNGILFTGSSSIRFWENPAKDFADETIINRGFGGSEIIDLIENFDQIILQYHPNKIVIYSGDNDIAAGKSAEVVYGNFCMLFGMIKETLPNAKVYYIAIKPSLNRWSQVLEMAKANNLINEFLNTSQNGFFVDIFSPMIGLDGKPTEKLFREDGLHLSKEGYQLWSQILMPYIKN